MTHAFNCKTTWRGGLAGCGMLSCSGLETKFSAPTKLNGLGQGTNPEELLLAATSTCFLITLSALLDRAKTQVTGLSLDSEIIVEASVAFTIKSIRHLLSVTLSFGSTQAVIDQVQELIQRTEQLCMVSKALRPNVFIEVNSKFNVGT